jgi:hypothetical protein
MFTKAQISAAPNTLDSTDVQMWVAQIRSSARYRGNPELFPDLEDAIASVNGTIKAQQLNVTMAAIVALGTGEVRLSGGDDGLQFSQPAEREALINYALSVIYEPLAAVPQVTESATSSSAILYGRFGIGQRETVICTGCGFVHFGNCGIC